MQLTSDSMHKKPWQITEDEGALPGCRLPSVAGFYPWLHLHRLSFCGDEEETPWHGARDQAGDPATSGRQGHNR